MRISPFVLTSFVFLSVLAPAAFGQLNCEEAAATQLPWRQRPETLSGNPATAMKPVFGEISRVFGPPPKGLELTYGIAGLTYVPAADQDPIRIYESFVMIKDIVCERMGDGTRAIRPEGATGAWIYFRVNDFGGPLGNFTSATAMKLGPWELPLHMAGDLRLVEDPTGMNAIYAFNERNEQTLVGWYFSAIKSPPFRKVSWAELADVYRAYWNAKFDATIKRFEDSLASSQRSLQRVNADKSVSPKDREEFVRSLEAGDAKTRIAIANARSSREDMLRRTDAMKRRPDASSPAYVRNLNDLVYEPESLSAAPGSGRYVFVENRDIFDRSLPAWKPQTILVQFRRTDVSPAKTGFNERFEKEFDFNVVRRLLGMPAMPAPPTIAGIGSTPGGYTSGKLPATSKPEASGFSEDFSRSNVGQAPAGWTVSSPKAVVREFNGEKRLALKEPGLYFPDYAVLALPKEFTLEFDVSWSKDISYYSPNFTVHLGAARYDNALKRYDREQVNPNSYTSAPMERVAISIDPYWNDYGRWTLQVFDARGGFLANKSDKTPLFFRDRNTVSVRIVRNGASMTVYFNDKQVIQESVLGENIRWNFIGFGLSNAPNAEPGDEFSIGNIRLK